MMGTIVIVLLLTMWAGDGSVQTSGVVAPNMDICAKAGVELSAKVQDANLGSTVRWTCVEVKRNPDEPAEI